MTLTPFPDRELEEYIAQWRAFISRREGLPDAGLQALEGRLRDQVATLTEAGLTASEAFLIALKRLGSSNASSNEFACAHCGRFMATVAEPTATTTPTETLVVLSLVAAAVIAVKVPALFGVTLSPDQELPLFYARNASLFVFPLLAVYFAWKRGMNLARSLWLTLPFAAAAVFANAFPFPLRSDTEVLSILHLPIALWMAVGLAYVGGRRFNSSGRMNFVRFSGELAIYYVLIALGGGVFTGFTVMMFTAIDLKADWFLAGWLIPCGAAAAVIIASALVEAKQSVIGNIAPVLTRLFTPLFTVLLLVFLLTMVWTGNPINVERELLIGFDLLLAVVVGLVLYAASARDPEAPPNFFDGLQLLLVLSALAVDAVALWAIAARISEFGFTPNRVAALGENLILLVNLVGSAWLYVGFLRRQGTFAALERWQVAYLPVYSAWAALVVIVFPPLFDYL